MNERTKGLSIAKLVGIVCIGVMLLVLMGACSGGSPTATPTSNETSMTTTTPTVTRTPTPTPRPTPQPLFLNVFTPEDESVVETSEVAVTGETLPTAIVSVNGILVSLEDDGNFSTTITLEEGWNTIEVVASDIKGNEKGTVLMVAYLP